MAERSSYELLIQRLDQFIRKYYTNQMLRGLLITTAVSVGLFVLYAFIESQLYLSTTGRKLLFFSYLTVFLAVLVGGVIIPVSKYFRLGRVIGHDEAAKIIGKHFGNVEDKLLNILQLKSSLSATDNSLVMASIDQKAESIRLVPFSNAIDLGHNRKYLKYALPPVLALLFILFAAPSLITDSTYRIINNGREFERPAPFDIEIEESSLEIVQYDNFALDVKVVGEQLPSELFIKVDDYEYRLTKDALDKFSYQFNNVRKDTPFEVYSGRATSGTKVLKVLAKPKMLNFDVRLTFPSHTSRKPESLSNIGDLSVPEGTKVQWTFSTKSTDEMRMRFEKAEVIDLDMSGSAKFLYEKRIMTDENYAVLLSNKWVDKGDSLQFFIRANRDEIPSIDVEYLQDSFETNIYYFVGIASDDYGLTKLQFKYDRVDANGQILKSGSVPVPFTISRQTEYQYVLDINDYELAPGEKLNYYFEVYDNDSVRGSKSNKTNMMSHRIKSLDELKMDEQENEEEIKDKLQSAIEESKEVKEELKKLKEKLLQKQAPDWQDKKQLEKLMERQRQIQEKLNQAKVANEKNLQNQKELNLTPELMEKQERLQELFEETVNEEMKQLMEQIQQLMQELNKEQTIQSMENVEMNEEKLQKEMERLAELYKQLEVEKEMNESVQELEKLAEKLEKLSEETKKTNEEEKPSEDLLNEHNEIEEKFDDLKEKMKDLKKKNEELEFPKPIPQDAPEQQEEVSKDLKEGEKQLEQQQNSKASESQKKAADKMKKMAGDMQQQMQSGQQEQMNEDIKTLRQLLENLVGLSFTQEDLVNNINRATINTPRYVSLVKDQKKIQDDFKIVEDTLQALSKRQPQIETFVLEKVTDIKSYLKSSLYELEERKKPEANQEQRSTMKNLNDLALMLSEAMEQMQQQMAGMMSGNQMCQNPGQNTEGGKSGEVPMDKLTEGQEKMSEDLKEMIDKLKSGQGNSSKDFAEAAARQAALRKALEDLRKSQQEQGQGFDDQLQQIIDEMNKQEIDLVNKRLDTELLKRQQDIMTRLLEADRAQREREYDDQRQSESGLQIKRALPPSLEQYLKERKAVLEQYKYVSPELKPYYRTLVDEYYKNLKRT